MAFGALIPINPEFAGTQIPLLLSRTEEFDDERAGLLLQRLIQRPADWDKAAAELLSNGVREDELENMAVEVQRKVLLAWSAG